VSNPHDETRVTGGSSSGSAALVRARNISQLVIGVCSSAVCDHITEICFLSRVLIVLLGMVLRQCGVQCSVMLCELVWPVDWRCCYCIDEAGA